LNLKDYVLRNLTILVIKCVWEEY